MAIDRANTLPYVVAVTVTYANRVDLCVNTIRAAFTAGCHHLVLVSNGSEQVVIDKIKSEISDHIEKVTIIVNESNMGSAGGFHQGVMAASKMGMQYIWLLDDDNAAAPQCLTEALSGLESLLRNSSTRSRVGISCNRTGSPEHARLSDGWSPDLVYPPAGSFMNFDLWHRIRRALTSHGRHFANEADVLVPVPYGPYGGLIIETEAARVIGLPDPSLYLYEDDTEYTARLVRSGMKLYWHRNASVADQDGKWSEAAGKSGLSGIAGASDSLRLKMSVRNRISFDVERLGNSKAQQLRFLINGLIFSAAFTLAAIRSHRKANLLIFFCAAYQGSRAHRSAVK